MSDELPVTAPVPVTVPPAPAPGASCTGLASSSSPHGSPRSFSWVKRDEVAKRRSPGFVQGRGSVKMGNVRRAKFNTLMSRRDSYMTLSRATRSGNDIFAPPTSAGTMQEKVFEDELPFAARKLVDPQQYVFFDTLTGDPRAWYWQGSDGSYEFYDSQGFQPQTGDPLKVATRDVVDGWKKYVESQKSTAPSEQPPRVPKPVDPDTYVFFDTLSGAPRAWYWQGSDGNYLFYDSQGFQPQTGDPLKVATRDVVDAWKRYVERRENAPQLVDHNKYPFFDPVTGAAQVWYWHSDHGAYQFFNAPGFHPQTGDKLLIVTPDAVAKWKQDSRPPTAPIAPPRSTLDEPYNVSWQLRRRTAEFLDLLYRDDTFAASSGNYADQVNYYGKAYSREQVMAELRNFTNRWPLREYKIRQGSLVINCDEQSLTCSAAGLLDFDSRSPTRNQRSWGVATFQYVLKFASATTAPRIIQEAGDVKVRNLEPFSNFTPPPPGTQPPNTGIPPDAAIMLGIVGGILNRVGR